MISVMHESVINIGQISFWEHNQILLEVLGHNGDRLLMRQFIIASTEELEGNLYDYIDILISNGTENHRAKIHDI